MQARQGALPDGELVPLLDRLLEEEGRLEDGRAALAEELDRLARDKDELQKLNGAALEAERVRHERESMERAVQQLWNLKKDISALERLQISCQKAREDHQEKAGIVQEREDAWQRINRAYLDAQAGVLAGSLCPGMSCPVCGSLEHPHPAPVSQEAPDETVWKQAEQSAKLAQQRAAEASRTAGERKTELKTREEQLCRKAQDLLPALRRAALPGMEELSVVETEQNALLQTAREQENDAKDRVKQAKDLGEAIPERERSSAEEDDRLTELDREITRHRAAVEGKRRQEAEKEIAALREKEAALQKKIQDAKTCRTDLGKQREAALGKLETYQALLRDGEDLDLEQAESRKETLAQEKEELEKSGERLTWLKALSDTANSALTG